jgi:hypothetical protein
VWSDFPFSESQIRPHLMGINQKLIVGLNFGKMTVRSEAIVNLSKNSVNIGELGGINECQSGQDRTGHKS